MNLCKDSRTSAGKKEALRLGHRKLIGSRRKRPCVPFSTRRGRAGRGSVLLTGVALNIEHELFHNLEN
jgi:hypothetical protein